MYLAGIVLGAAVPWAQSQYNGLWLGTINEGDCLKRSGGAIIGATCGGGESVPAGSIVFIITGTCPTGYVEEAGINGRTLLGTLAANGNVGTTGGADSITPTGVNSGTAVADHVSHTHTYTQVPNHVHVERAQGGTTASTTGTHLMTSTATGGSLRSSAASTLDPTGGVATGTTAGPGATLTHTVSAQPTFTGTQFDNRSAYVRVIACRKS